MLAAFTLSAHPCSSCPRPTEMQEERTAATGAQRTVSPSGTTGRALALGQGWEQGRWWGCQIWSAPMSGNFEQK